MLAYTLKPRVKVMGPKYGPLVQKILAVLKSLDEHSVQVAAQQVEQTGSFFLAVDGLELELTRAEVDVASTARPGFVTAEDRGYIVALETTITPELRNEGPDTLYSGYAKTSGLQCRGPHRCGSLY